MEISVYILLALVGFIMFLFLFFHIKNKRIKIHHFQKIKSLKKSIILHHNQISFRQSNMSKYNFLTYNLNEVLVPQPEIKL